MSPIEVTFIVVQLIFLEGILSIDNAAVLGAMVSELPANQPIPWPDRLGFMRSHGARILGGQRAAALKVGLLGAYAGRALMLLMAAYVIRNPWLRLIGAAYLLKLSISHLAFGPHYSDASPEEHVKAIKASNFWRVVLMVELADLAFSIDNVVAAVALSNHILIVMLGVALGIVTMRFAAQIFTVLIEREPILAPTAYVLVLNISLELLIEESADFLGVGVHFAHWQKFVISAATIALALLYVHWPWLNRTLHPLIQALRRFLGYLNYGIDFSLRPFTRSLSLLVSTIRNYIESKSGAAPSGS